MSWKNIENEILSDLRGRWPNAPKLDELDISALEMALDPAARMVESGKMREDDSRIWKIRIGIRNSRFRPSSLEIEEIVDKALGLVSEDLARAYAPVSAPQKPADEPAPALDAVPRWTRYLSPTGIPELDGILTKSLEATRRRRGEEAAVRAARIMAQQRIDQEENQRREVASILSVIPEGQREEYLEMARRKLHVKAKLLQVAQSAARLYSQRQRERRHTSALSQWQAAWIPADMETSR